MSISRKRTGVVKQKFQPGRCGGSILRNIWQQPDYVKGIGLAGDFDPLSAEDGVDAEGDEAESDYAQQEGAVGLVG